MGISQQRAEEQAKKKAYWRGQLEGWQNSGMSASSYCRSQGICERFHKTILQEFYQVTFRKKLYDSIDELQKDLGEWLHYYNNERTHQGKMCCGQTPIQTLADGKQFWKEKFIN